MPNRQPRFIRVRYWALVLMGTVLAFFMPSEAEARGGRGRGGGGRGRGGGGWGGRGGGAAGRAAAAAARGRGRNGRGDNKKEQEEDRREERMARVAEARLVYAKRERQEMWDNESRDRFGKMLRRILEGASE